MTVLDLATATSGTVLRSPNLAYFTLQESGSDDHGPFALIAPTGWRDDWQRHKLYHRDAEGWTLPVITAGDRVSLAVSDLPDPVSGTVLRVYTDAIGGEVADVHLYGKRIAYQCTRFLLPAGAAS